MHPTHDIRQRSQAGFGLVEAIVAAFVILVVAITVTTILVHTTRSQARTSLSERRLAAAEGLFERLKADNAWSGSNGAGCDTMALNVVRISCSASWLQSRYTADGLINQSDVDQPIRYETQFEVTGVDDNVDGLGADDNDGTRPDYYHATIRVRRQGSSDTWTELTGTIDPPGRATSGAISINVCQVVRQWDERAPIASCRASQQMLLGYPAGGLTSIFGGGADPHAQADWRAALDRAAPAAGERGWDMVTYDVVSAQDVTVILRRIDGGVVHVPGFVPPVGCSATSTTQLRCVTDRSRPILRVAGLTPGHYSIRLTDIPIGYEPWPLHSIPSGDTAIVESGKASRVLQVLRPVNRDRYEISLRSCNETRVPSWGSGPCIDEMQPGGVSGFLAPAASARATWSDFATAPRGANRLVFRNLAPGLYSGRFVTGAQGSRILTHGAGGARLDYIWLDPVRHGLSGDEPASGVPTFTNRWCEGYEERAAYLASVGLGPAGGEITRYRNIYDSEGNVIDTEPYQVHYYGADACAGSSSGGGPPGPGTGGA